MPLTSRTMSLPGVDAPVLEQRDQVRAVGRVRLRPADRAEEDLAAPREVRLETSISGARKSVFGPAMISTVASAGHLLLLRQHDLSTAKLSEASAAAIAL